MIYLQVVTEIEVDDTSIIENNMDDWKSVGPSIGWDVIEFIDYLIESNVLTVDDLGQVAHQSIMPL